METDGTALVQRRCRPCEGGIEPLGEAQVRDLLGRLDGWDLLQGELVKLFRFKGFDETMAFVNAIAWVSRREDHHPDLEVSWGSCKVRYHTHAIGGLSENDFICAAKVDALL
jgi:4a-hydroxytetrahydrobiopterin dehydratase